MPGGNFLDPQSILIQCEIPQGSVVADFGCGSGYFSLPLAQIIGESGRVYSFDVRPEALEAVESKMKTAGISNIVTKRANLEVKEGSELAENSVDFIVIKDVLFQNKDKESILQEAKRVLKPAANVIIVEWNESFLGIGPQADLRISKSEMKKLVESQGFVFEKEIQAGEFHYAILIKKI